MLCTSAIHSVSLTTLVLNLDSFLDPLVKCQRISLIIPALIIHHFFTLSLQAQNLPFQQILPTFIDFFYLLDCLMIMGLDRTDHAHHFIISFTL